MRLTEKANNRDPASSCCARAENSTQSFLPKLVRVPEKYGRRPLRATPKYFSAEKNHHVYITRRNFEETTPKGHGTHTGKNFVGRRRVRAHTRAKT